MMSDSYWEPTSPCCDEVQAILQDPAVRQALQDLSPGGDAAAGQRAMADPKMRGKIEKLLAAGVLQSK